MIGGGKTATESTFQKREEVKSRVRKRRIGGIAWNDWGSSQKLNHREVERVS